MAQLPSPQTPRVHRLEGDRVAVGGESAPQAGAQDALHLIVREVEERLQLRGGEGALVRAFWTFLAVRQPAGRDRHERFAEQLRAVLSPGIERVRDIDEEEREIVLDRANRRRRQVVDAAQLGGEVVCFELRPLPRVLSRPVDESFDRPLATTRCALLEPLRELCMRPTVEHRGAQRLRVDGRTGGAKQANPTGRLHRNLRVTICTIDASDATLGTKSPVSAHSD